MTSLPEPPLTDGRELIVVLAKSGTREGLETLATSLGGAATPLFPRREGDVEVLDRDLGERLAERMSRFYGIDAPEEHLDEIADALRTQPEVEAAYVKPPASVPAIAPPDTEPTSFPEGDLLTIHPYLGPAPTGVGATDAWLESGGAGEDVIIIDMEFNWILGHEDLPLSQDSILFGVPRGDWDHGSAVVGVMAGVKNAIAITGIAHQSQIRLAPSYGVKKSSVIRLAAAWLADRGPGNVLNIVLERPGPTAASWPAKKIYEIPLEWWEDEYLAIRDAVNLGVIVVEAAGNSGVNLNDPIYSIRDPKFSQYWENPFERRNDSGSIVVGAGAPPPGVHNRDWGPDRSRTKESNYGKVVDAQGWGHEVVTAGYGHLSGSTPETSYTDFFGGTSAATPMVAAVVACVQGARKKANKRVLNGFEMRAALRYAKNGSPQQDEASRPATERIGTRPDLAKLLQLP